MRKNLTRRRCTEDCNLTEHSRDLDLLTLRGFSNKTLLQTSNSSVNKNSIKTELFDSDFSTITDFSTDLLKRGLLSSFTLLSEGSKLRRKIAQSSKEMKKRSMENFNRKSEQGANNESSTEEHYCNQDLLMPKLQGRSPERSNKISGKKCYMSDSECESSTSSHGSVDNRELLKKKHGDNAKKVEHPKLEYSSASHFSKHMEKKLQNQAHSLNMGPLPLFKAGDESDPEFDLSKFNFSRSIKNRPDQKKKLIKDKRYGLPCFESTNVYSQILPCGVNKDGGDTYKRDLSGSLIDSVNWSEIRIPKKRDLHRVIHYRLCNYISPDITLIIDEYEFFCHRIVLQCYSKYFDRINNLQQYNTTTVIDLKEKNVTKEAFIAIYAWMLSLNDAGLKFITRENILEVLMAAQALEISDLEEQCFALINSKDIFSEGHAYLLFKQASQAQNSKIKELMVPRIQHFFLPLVSTQDFVMLSVEDLCTFLSSNYIVVHGEMEVFMAAAKWLLEDWDERKKHLPKVLNCVRFGLMNPPELIDIKKNPESPQFLKITEDPRIQKYIEDGMAYSIESTLKGATEDHKHRCKLLGLKVPQPRNWAENPKNYKSYEEFIGYLQLLRSNPMLLFSKDPPPTSPGPPMRQTHAKYSLPVEHNTSCSDIIGFPYTYNPVSEDGIPSMSILLSAGKINQKKRESRKETLRISSVSQGKTKELTKPAKKTLITQKNESKNEIGNHESAENTKRSVQRKEMSLRNKAATIIQSAYRGYKAREMLKIKKKDLVRKVHYRNKSLEEHKTYEGHVDERLSKQVQNCSSESDLDTVNRHSRNLRASLYFPHSQTILVIGGLDPLKNLSQNNDGTCVFRYCLEMNIWEKVATMPKGRYYHNAALLKGKIYVLGGVDPTKEDSGVPPISSDMWSFNPSTCEWEKEPSLKIARKTFGLVAFHGYLYIIGGQDNHERILSSVEKYDPAKGVWEEVCALPEPRLCPAVCRYGGMIWVAGGMGSSAKNDMSSSIFCFDPQQNMWIRKPTLRFGRGFSTLINHEDSLLLVGGAIKEGDVSVSNDIIDILETKQSKWKLHSHMNIPRHSHTVSCIGSKMFIIGGTTTKHRKTLCNVEMCCLKTGIWNRQVADLPMPLTGHASVTLPLGSPVV